MRPSTIRATGILALALAVAPAAAQPRIPTTPATLGGVRFEVPRTFARSAAQSDAGIAVFANAEAGHALFVATLAADEQRADVLERSVERVVQAALGAAGSRPFAWRLMSSPLRSRFEAYHERRMGFDGTRGVIVQVSHLRRAGGDVLTGYAFTAGDDAAALFESVRTTLESYPAGEASHLVITSLVGETPAETFAPPAEGPPVQGPPAQGPPAAGPARAAHPEAAAVRAVFDGYREAVLARNGKAAAALVAEPMVQYFADMQRAALTAPAARVRAMPLVNRFFVLTFRHRISAETLRSLSPSELVAHSIEQGWTSAEATAAQRVGRVQVQGNLAFASMTVNGQPSGEQASFARRDREWKLDLLPILMSADGQLRALARQSGGQEDAFLLTVLTSISGSRPADTIWDPPPVAAPRP